MLQRLREWLTLLLLCVLPFHAFLVTVGTKLLAGPDLAPLAALALWKEGLLAVIVLLALLEIFTRDWGASGKSPWTFDTLDWLIIAGLILASLVSMDPATVAGGGGLQGIFRFQAAANKRFLLGLKYDFLPLVVFFFLRRVPWSESFFRRALLSLAVVGIIVAGYGIVTSVLPVGFFTSLGYSAAHSLYNPRGALAAFQQVEGLDVRRIQSVMSGPNQLGLWLLLPLTIVLWLMVRAMRAHLRGGRPLQASSLLLWLFSSATILAALMLTVSRAAWVAACAIVTAFLLLALRRAWSQVRFRVLLLVLLLSFVGGSVLALALAVRLKPDLVVRTQSFQGHIEKPLQALSLIRQHPIGLGLGAAGPASNALSDVCVFLPLGADYSWADGRTDLCVFVGGTRRLPAGKVCDCPLLTENWYLQWGVELGVLGLMLSLALALFVLLRLLSSPLTSFRMPVLLAFLGVSIAGLFLHAFEDSAVAYSLWLLLSASLPQVRVEKAGERCSFVAHGP